MNSDWSQVFAGRDTDAFYHPQPGAETLVVTFDFLSQPMRPPHVPGGEVIKAAGASQIHIVTDADHWYQGIDFAGLISTLVNLRAKYSRLVLYGGSMGGYGALLFSGALKADRVVALCPQFTPDPAKAPHETRWRDKTAGLIFTNDNMADMASPSAEKLIIYDRSCKEDERQVSLIRQLPNVSEILVPFSSHYTLHYFHESGVMREALRTLYFGESPVSDLRMLRRRGRRKSARYLSELAKRLGQRGRINDALTLLNQAYVLDNARPTAIDAYIGVLMSDPERYDGILHLVLRLLGHEMPAWTHYDGLRSDIWAKLESKYRPT